MKQPFETSSSDLNTKIGNETLAMAKLKPNKREQTKGKKYNTKPKNELTNRSNGSCVFHFDRVKYYYTYTHFVFWFCLSSRLLLLPPSHDDTKCELKKEIKRPHNIYI